MINPEFILQAINNQVFGGKYADVSIAIGQTDDPRADAEMHWWIHGEELPYIIVNQRVLDAGNFNIVFMLVLHEICHYSSRAVAPDEHGELFIAECQRVEAILGMAEYHRDYKYWPLSENDQDWLLVNAPYPAKH